MHEVAPVLDQLNVLVPPGLTVIGLAESVTLGAPDCAAAGVATMLASARSANRTSDFMAAIISKRGLTRVYLNTDMLSGHSYVAAPSRQHLTHSVRPIPLVTDYPRIRTRTRSTAHAVRESEDENFQRRIAIRTFS